MKAFCWEGMVGKGLKARAKWKRNGFWIESDGVNIENGGLVRMNCHWRRKALKTTNLVEESITKQLDDGTKSRSSNKAPCRCSCCTWRGCRRRKPRSGGGFDHSGLATRPDSRPDRSRTPCLKQWHGLDPMMIRRCKTYSQTTNITMETFLWRRTFRADRLIT